MKPVQHTPESLLTLKMDLINYLEKMVDEKVAAAEADVLSAQTSRDSATKSSAGDKHETGRAMMQIEMENHVTQLAKAKTLRAELRQLTFDKHFDMVEAGSLVVTDQGIYLLSIGLGKLEMRNEVVFVLSVASPLGRALFGKKVSDVVVFHDKNMTIKSIV